MYTFNSLEIHFDNIVQQKMHESQFKHIYGQACEHPFLYACNYGVKLVLLVIVTFLNKSYYCSLSDLDLSLYLAQCPCCYTLLKNWDLTPTKKKHFHNCPGWFMVDVAK